MYPYKKQAEPIGCQITATADSTPTTSPKTTTFPSLATSSNSKTASAAMATVAAMPASLIHHPPLPNRATAAVAAASSSSAADDDADSRALTLRGTTHSPSNSTANAADLTVSVPSVPGTARKLCLRHQRMADENTTAKLQKSIQSLPLADQAAVNNVWTIFSSSPHPRRALILQGLLTMCCFSQLSLLSEELALAIRIDPFSLFPREISLKVLGYLDANSLGRAAQVSRLWRSLADDDILWRNMCMQHIERKCEKCGWGLPLLKDGGRRRKTAKTGAAALTASSSSGSPRLSILELQGESSQGPSARAASAVASTSASGSGSLKRTITAAANAAAHERHRNANSTQTSPALAPQTSEDEPDHMNIDAHPNKRLKTSQHGCSAGAKEKDPQNLSSVSEKLSAAPKASSSSSSTANGTSTTPLTRPWKNVYCERLMIERNWRKCRYTTRILSGHEDGIMCLAYNDHLSHPQFPVLITGSYDRTARVWNLETGEQLHVLRGHTRVVRCLQFDDCKLITGSMDRTLKIWNWRTGELMRTLEGHTEGILCLNFNEEILASGSLDNSIKIWNFRTGQCYTLRGHNDWVNHVMLWSGKGAKDGKKAANSGSGADEHNWDERAMRSVPAPTMIGLEEDHDTFAKHFVFSASDDGTIRLWDLGLRECILVFEGHVGQVQSIKLIHLDDDSIRKLAQSAFGGPGAEEAERRRQELAMAQHNGGSNPTGGAHGGAGAGAGGPGGDAFPLPTPPSRLPAHGSHHHHQSHHRHLHHSDTDPSSANNANAASSTATEISADSDSYFNLGPAVEGSSAATGSHNAAAGPSGTSAAADAEGGGCSIVPTTPSFTHAPQRSRSGSTLGHGPLASGLVLRHSPTIGSSSGAMNAVVESATPGLASPAFASTRFEDVTAPLSPAVDEGPRHRRALDPVLARVQQRLEAAGLVPSIPLDAEMSDIEGPLSETFDEQDAVAQGVAGPSARGRPQESGYMRLSNAAILGAGNGASSSQSRRNLSPHVNGSGSQGGHTTPKSSALRPVLVSGSLDNTIKLWDVRTGRCLRTFFGHVQGVWSLDADKLRIISASLDRTIKIWDRETGYCQNTLVGHRGAVTCVALGDDKIVSGSDDNDVRVWSFADR
ncbi:hypothetical protein OC845_000323 [Tilletia horrida]|nr:hypothetical protein OC845_000323 [Tilletia horrida]